jgi:archaellum component FlaC
MGVHPRRVVGYALNLVRRPTIADQPEPTLRDVLDAVNTLSTRTDERFAALQSLTNRRAIDTLEAVHALAKQTDDHFTAVHTRFDAVDQRLETIDTRLIRHEERIEALETQG